MQDFNLAIDGMHCMACVRRVKDALARTPGVVDAVVEVGKVKGQLDGAVLPEVIAAIAKVGYVAKSAE